jgi:hypothetical protein
MAFVLMFPNPADMPPFGMTKGVESVPVPKPFKV